jgi:arginase
MCGDPRHPAAQGPAVLTKAVGAEGGTQVRRVTVPPFAGDSRLASLDVCRNVARLVDEVVRLGDLPLVLAGSCDVAAGVLSGLCDDSLGVVWIDAHADFNTPDSSASGFWPGMALAVVVGDCGDAVRAAVELQPVPQERVALLGIRSISPQEEARRVERSAMQVVPWQDGMPKEDVGAVLDRLESRCRSVYLHLDLDALDPAVGMGVVDVPVPGGLTGQQLAEVLDGVLGRFSVAGATIATYTPAKDDGSTLAAAVAMVRMLTNAHPNEQAL